MTTYLARDEGGNRLIGDIASAAWSSFDRLAKGGAHGRRQLNRQARLASPTGAGARRDEDHEATLLRQRIRSTRQACEQYTRGDGHGIEAGDLGRVFDPFYTTKDVGRGAGLGLDVVQAIVQHHRGSVDVASQPGRTEFRVALPVSETEGTHRME